MSLRAFAAVVLLVGSLGVLLGCTPVADDDDSTEIVLPAEAGALQTTNAADRSGWYSLPERTQGAPIPYLLVFHATGSNGRAMAERFTAHSVARGFAVVAPDSRVSPQGDYTWEVGTDPGEITPDYEHAVDCLDEVLDFSDTPLDPEAVLAAGYSGGASSAPYLATNHDSFRSFARIGPIRRILSTHGRRGSQRGEQREARRALQMD